MSKSLADLRDLLFAQLEELNNPTKVLDLKRHQVMNEVARNIIDTAKVEVALAAVLKGALDVPFVEGQTTERKTQSLPPPNPQEKAAAVINGGPSADHPWRASVVHRLKR
jgi:hypothetical protein